MTCYSSRLVSASPSRLGPRCTHTSVSRSCSCIDIIGEASAVFSVRCLSFFIFPLFFCSFSLSTSGTIIDFYVGERKRAFQERSWSERRLAEVCGGRGGRWRKGRRHSCMHEDKKEKKEAAEELSTAGIFIARDGERVRRSMGDRQSWRWLTLCRPADMEAIACSCRWVSQVSDKPPVLEFIHLFATWERERKRAFDTFFDIKLYSYKSYGSNSDNSL